MTNETPIKKGTSALTWLAAGVCALVVASCLYSQQERRDESDRAAAARVQAEAARSPEAKAAEVAARAKREAESSRVSIVLAALKQSAKNPASFDVVSAGFTAAGSVCVVYRATNSFNALVTEQVVIDEASKRGDWNKLCAGQAAVDYTNVKRRL